MCFLFYKRDCLACDFRKMSLANCDVRSFADGERWLHYTENSVISTEEAKKEKKQETFYFYFFLSFLNCL